MPFQNLERIVGEIVNFLHSLRTRPETPGDYTEKDASLREHQVKIIGKYAVMYWVDQPVQAVMVVSISPADL